MNPYRHTILQSSGGGGITPTFFGQFLFYSCTGVLHRIVSCFTSFIQLFSSADSGYSFLGFLLSFGSDKGETPQGNVLVMSEDPLSDKSIQRLGKNKLEKIRPMDSSNNHPLAKMVLPYFLTGR